jgi:hypothetical protein
MHPKEAVSDEVEKWWYTDTDKTETDINKTAWKSGT